jgi:hypothetical protein
VQQKNRPFEQGWSIEREIGIIVGPINALRSSHPRITKVGHLGGSRVYIRTCGQHSDGTLRNPVDQVPAGLRLGIAPPGE